MTTVAEAAADFLAQRRIAVAGVSRQAAGHGGNYIYKTLKKRGYEVFAVNPNAETVEGDPCFHTLADIPGVERVVPGLQPGDDFDWRTGSHAFAATILGTAPDHATALRIRDEFISRVVITGRP